MARFGPKPRPASDRLWANVDKAGPLPPWAPFLGQCWIWAAGLTTDGYGRIGVGSRADGTRRTRRAHVVAYELNVGPIPDGMVIDHLCRVRHCVNPAHLEAVTPAENLRRSNNTLATVNSRKTHCPNGHPYDEANTYRFENHRSCRECRRESDRKSRGVAA